jgi:hypothetical protein
LHAETKRRQGRRSRKKSPGRQPTAVSRDESRLVTISWDNKVRWWDITKPEPVMHPAIALFCVTRDHHQFATRPKKKTNVVQHLLVFHHIGLLVNEPSSERFGWSAPYLVIRTFSSWRTNFRSTLVLYSVYPI